MKYYVYHDTKTNKVFYAYGEIKRDNFRPIAQTDSYIAAITAVDNFNLLLDKEKN